MVTIGGQGSNSASLPSAHMSTHVTVTTTTAPSRPSARRALHPMSQMAAIMIAPAPTATPAP